MKSSQQIASDSLYGQRLVDLNHSPRTWLVTGAAGFIGSNLVEELLRQGQRVVGLDNFLTGHQRNLDEVRGLVAADQWRSFRFIEGDIRDREACAAAVDGVDVVLHQAALGSVPRSLDDPLTSHDVNVTGFLNLLDAARLAGVARFVYATSSSVYGDSPALPKREEDIGNPLSPYAATKLINEVYASVYERSYGMSCIGLRYFNVFGPRQDPDGPYAAVIPKWAAAMIAGQPIAIFGDGTTSRDFCYVRNAVQANLLAGCADAPQAPVFNVAVGAQTSLTSLFDALCANLERHQIHYKHAPAFHDFRAGDVRHSKASIAKAAAQLGYAPTHSLEDGLAEAVPWYIEQFREHARAQPVAG